MIDKSFDQLEVQSAEDDSIRSQIRKMDPICKTRKKAAVDLHQSSMEQDSDIDPGEQFFQGTCCDDDNEYKGSKSGANPDEETSLVASRRTRITDVVSHQDDCRKEKGSIPLKILLCNDASDSSTPGSTLIDSSCSSQVSDSERKSFLVSLLNLDGEDSRLIPDTELEMDNLLSGFPSPSCRSSIYNNSTPSTLTDERITYVTFQEETCQDSVDLEDFRADEPLFWPSDWKQDWNSEETWKCFSMSPRKYTTTLGIPQDENPKPVQSKSRIPKLGSERNCRRRLEFITKSTAASKILEQKQISDTTCPKKINMTPSRLRKSTKNSMKTVPVETEDDVEEEEEDREVTMAKPNQTERGLSEDEMISNEELPIESVVGLGEFDGHEGVDSEYNEDVFPLDESLQGSK